MSKIIIVDSEDNQIGIKERSEITPDDIYRISGLWVTNSKGQILLAQRKMDKKTEPGCWGPAVSGTVEEGESYEDNIYKEAAEEIGLSGLEFKKTIKIPAGLVGNHFVQVFEVNIDKDLNEFKIQEEEVEALKWVDRIWLVKDIKNNPESYVASAPYWETEFSIQLS